MVCCYKHIRLVITMLERMSRSRYQVCDEGKLLSRVTEMSSKSMANDISGAVCRAANARKKRWRDAALPLLTSDRQVLGH